jgi:hypothetical protein
MQFVKNGPDIPERLLEAHEDGQVVFFCGAGISPPAGLPDFKGLVKAIYEKLGTEPDPTESQAMENKQYDTVVGLLENRVVGGRRVVRETLVDILKPNSDLEGATSTHEALLTLAKDSKNNTRLVTTNFDRIFENVRSQQVRSFAAPLLPIPKNRWDGIVYLHGLLPNEPSESDLNQLVLSSGDFGLAYLVERWASRFISELFRKYTICFVGYSIDDPVMRYMMDALAADRMLGESTSETFAFGSYTTENEKSTPDEWKAKSVTPILYKADSSDHSLLHKTLKEWAEVYRDGISGKQGIISRYAKDKPSPVKDDDQIGRVLWALTDETGMAARTFAELTPPPPIEWLAHLCDLRYTYEDLPRFGIQPLPLYTLSSRMTLVSQGNAVNSGGLDPVMKGLAQWFTCHLESKKLLRWVISSGASPHPELCRLINDKVNEGSLAPAIATIWKMLVNGHVITHNRHFKAFEWSGRFEKQGWSHSLKESLLRLLKPKIKFKEFCQGTEDEMDTSAKTAAVIINSEIVPADHDSSDAIKAIRSTPNGDSIFGDLLPNFTELLRDALGLLNELGEANEKEDHSYWHRPSISEHEQNENHQEWTLLIELCRDAWVAVAKSNVELAQVELRRWRTIRYPVFRRLELFAATHPAIVDISTALDILLADEHWWLWSVETRRETLRLLATRAGELQDSNLTSLTDAILQGPPQGMFSEDVDPDRLLRYRDHYTWLRLAKIQKAGAMLSDNALSELNRLTAAYPDWELDANQKDEFLVWMAGIGQSIYLNTPNDLTKLVEWLENHPNNEFCQDDDWRERCRNDFLIAAKALATLASRDVWPIRRWQTALQVWSSDEKLTLESWKHLWSTVSNAPNDIIRELIHALGSWLQSVAPLITTNESKFFLLVRCLLEQVSQKIVPDNDNVGEEIDSDDGDLVFKAINHPAGHVTQALIQWWFKQDPQDHQTLPEELKKLFDQIADTEISVFRHGRLVLASYAISLFRVDPDWAKAKLLPLFDWNCSKVEARSAWEGYLRSARLYRPLLEAFKQSFLDTASHYGQLGQYRKGYAWLLTIASVESKDVLSVEECRKATVLLPNESLVAAIDQLIEMVSSVGDSRREYWQNRLQPYIQKIWPKDNNKRTVELSRAFALLCIAAGEAFPSAIKELKNWLQPIQDWSSCVHKLDKSGLCKSHPEDVLTLLDKIIGEEYSHIFDGLKNCLKQIADAKPELAQDRRYKRLVDFLKKFNAWQ